MIKLRTDVASCTRNYQFNVGSHINRRGLEQTVLTADFVIYFVNLSYEFAIEVINEFDINNAHERVKRGTFEFDRFTWISKAFEHQTHHRGQTTIYIRLVGIKPPNEKLF